MRQVRPFDDFAADFRYGIRQLRRAPVFTAAAVLSLALGIGPNTAIFSLIDAVMLAELPVPAPEQLSVASIERPGRPSNPRFAYPVYAAARERLAGKAELAVMTSTNRQQGRPGGAGETPQPIEVQLVSGTWFELLRQQPFLGRLFSAADDVTLGGHPVAVLSHGYWQRAFGSAPDVVGQQMLVNGVSFTIVGVTKPGFIGAIADRQPEVWIPAMMQSAVRHRNNASISNGDDNAPWPPQVEVSWLALMVRAERPEQRVEAASVLTSTLQELTASGPGMQDADDDAFAALEQSHVALRPAAKGLSQTRQQASAPLLVLLGLVSLLLTIACANVASLLLARGAARHRELTVRSSLGAGRGRLVRQLLTESLLLALLGSVAGLLLAQGVTWLLLKSLPIQLAGPPPQVFTSGLTLLYTFGLSLASALLFGLLPALRASAAQLAGALAGRGFVGGRTSQRWGRALVAGQLAMSLLLLIVAGLFARSLGELSKVDLGLDRDRLLMVGIDPRSSGSSAAEMNALLEEIRALPGVESASMSAFGILSSSQRTSSFGLEGRVPAPGEDLILSEEFIAEDYLATVGLPLLAGRAFEPADFTAGTATLINETMAKKFFPNGDAIGKHWGYDPENPVENEIVGIVGDVRQFGVKGELPWLVYRPATEERRSSLSSLEIRAAGSPKLLIEPVRKTLEQKAPNLLVRQAETLDERARRSVGQERALSGLTSAFGTLALLLAGVGLYGTISYAVARRVQEIGVRLALGAAPRKVLSMILGDAFRLVGAGLVVGVPLAYFAAKAVEKLLFGIRPTDVSSWTLAIALLAAVAALAAFGPARRAGKVDPLVALREE